MRFGKESIKWALIVSEHIGAEEIGDELDHVYAQAAKADEYEADLNEVKRQLKIKIRHARRDGDYSEASALSEAFEMIEYLI